MKNCVKILAVLCIGVFAGLLVRGIPVVLHVQAGGGVPHADQNGDVNGDARLDISDAIYLVRYFFRGGPEPVALAQGEPADLAALEDSVNRIADSLDNLVALEQGRIVPNIQRLEAPLTRIADSLENQNGSTGCDQRSDRFIWQEEDQTIIDTCKNLMWADHDSWVREFHEAAGGPNHLLNDFQHAGYSDWRLPTIEELSSLWSDSPLRFSEAEISRPFWLSSTTEFFTSTVLPPGDRFVRFSFGANATERISLYDCRGGPCIGRHRFLPVRDIDPGE